MSDNEPGLKEKLTSNLQDPIISNNEDDTLQQQGSFQPSKVCTTLMIMALLGAISMQIGLWIGPDDCDNDNFFEIIGGAAFWISVLAIPFNGLSFLISLINPEIPSVRIFLWSLAHIAVIFITGMVFGEAVFQDIFCNSDGPHYDIGAGF